MCGYIHETDVSTHIQRVIFIHSFIYLYTKLFFQHLQADGRDDMTGQKLKGCLRQFGIAHKTCNYKRDDSMKNIQYVSRKG